MKIYLIPVLIFLITISVSCQNTEKAYYSDGKPKFVIPKDSQGKIDGEAKWWYENGSLMLTANYQNGVLNGKMTRFFHNGNKQSEDQYLQGKLDGISQEMDFNGNVFSEKTYVNGVLNGISRRFDGIGQLIEEGNYKNGFFDGEWKYFDQFGRLSATANFNHGSGIKKSWNENGNVTKTTEYRNNLIHGNETLYDESGHKVRIRKFMDGEMVSERPVQPDEQ